MKEVRVGSANRGLKAQSARWLPAVVRACLAVALYIVVGVLRHEASHAAAVWIQGGRVLEVALLPEEGSWGYVMFAPVKSELLVLAAPYLCDQVVVLLGWYWWGRSRMKGVASRIHLLGFTIVSALVNSAVNYAGAYAGRGDVARLMEGISTVTIHVYFCVAIGMLLWASVACGLELCR